MAIQGALLVSGVIVARLLGPENRGHLAFIVLAPLILSQIGHLGLPLAITYYTAKSPESQSILVRRAAKILLPAVGTCLALHLAIVLAFASTDGDGVLTAALFTIFATAGWTAQFVGLALLQGQQRFGLFNVLRVLQVGLYASLMIGLLFSGVHELSVVAGAWSFAIVASGSAALTCALRKTSPPAQSADDMPSAGSMVRFGLKSLPAQVSPVESFRIDQLVLGLLAGPTMLGYYVAANAITNLPRIVANSIGMVAYPKVAAARTNQFTVALRYTMATVSVCGAIVVGLEALSTYLIPFFFGAQFEAAVGIARILLLAAFFMSMRRILNDCARGLGRPELGLRAEMVSWAPLIPGFLMANNGEEVAWTLVASSALSVFALLAQLLRSHDRLAVPSPAMSSSTVA
jgi:O-antigen/teichoic acid export membrane protein